MPFFFAAATTAGLLHLEELAIPQARDLRPGPGRRRNLTTLNRVDHDAFLFCGSDDLDSVYATLMDFQADGGGDTPESVNKALYDAVHNISWSQGTQAYQVVFLVGDAPPHMDYQDEMKYPEIVAAAKKKGIVINTIQCGEIPTTTGPWTQIASLGHGKFFQVEQAGSAVALATPYDAEIAELSAMLDDTRLYFGTEEEKERMARTGLNR